MFRLSFNLVLPLLISFSHPTLALPTQVNGPDVTTRKEVTVNSGTKGLVVLFMSARCPCSNSHTNVIKDLARKFATKPQENQSKPDFEFVAVHANVDEAPDLTEPYFRNLELGFPVIEDNNQRWVKAFRPSRTPHAYIISPKGDVLFKGGVTDSSDAGNANRHYLEDALSDVRADKKVRTSEARTLGCTIARGTRSS